MRNVYRLALFGLTAALTGCGYEDHITAVENSQAGTLLYYPPVEEADRDTFRNYYPDYSIFQIIPLMDGKADGVAKEYSEDGKLISSVTYVDGVQDGEFTKYLDDGSFGCSGEYMNGQLIRLNTIDGDSVRHQQFPYVADAAHPVPLY